MEKIKQFKYFLPTSLVVILVICSIVLWKAPQLPVEATLAQIISDDATALDDGIVSGDFNLDDGVYEGSAMGYKANTSVAVTIADRTITDIEILSYGDDEAFFNRATAVVDTVIKNQSVDVDTVSGATYSSRGILDAINNALTGEEGSQTAHVASEDAPEVEDIEESGTYKDGVYYGTGTGFNGKTTVKVTIKNSQIKKINVVSTSDDAAYFNKARALLDDIIDTQSTNVDTVSGATYSSAGLIEAVRDALAKALVNGDDSDSEDSEDETQEDATPSVTGNYPYPDGTYQGSGTGFGGKITVEITIASQTLTKISIISAADETPSYLEKAKDVINRIISAQSTQVDVVSGATYSSNGIIEAVNNAVAAAAGQATTDTTSGSTSTDTGVDTVETATPTVTGNFPYADGTYRGTGYGFGGDIVLDVTIKDQTITSITVVSAADETASYFAKAKAVITSIITNQTTSVDVVSGATLSSNGIIEAVTNALKTAAGESTSSSTSETTTESGSDNTSDSSESEETTTTDDTTSDTLQFADGTYTASGICSGIEADGSYAGRSYTLTLTVKIASNRITSVSYTVSGEEFYEDDDDVYLSLALDGNKRTTGMISKFKALTSLSGFLDGTVTVDTVSGATCTSNGAIEALKAALEQARIKEGS